MALGRDIADQSLKSEAITHIRLRHRQNGMSFDDALSSTKGYRRKTVARLKAILVEERLTNGDNRADRGAA